MSLQIGDTIRIESYKFGDRLHRVWKESTLLKKGEPMIVANHNPQVVEADGFEHVAPGLAICIFSKIDWFHPVILFDVEDRVEKYYVDIASPYQWNSRDKVLTYVDYDLDLIVRTDFSYFWVDQEEYEYHSTLFQYPESVKEKIIEAKRKLVQKVEQKIKPFTSEFADYWCRQYRSYSK